MKTCDAFRLCCYAANEKDEAWIQIPISDGTFLAYDNNDNNKLEPPTLIMH